MNARMGDTIMFRGQRRFLVLAARGFIQLEKIQPNRYGKIAHYSVGSPERRTIRVVTKGTEKTRARARRLLRAECAAHTRIEWDGDAPTYVHTVNGIEHRT